MLVVIMVLIVFSLVILVMAYAFIMGGAFIAFIMGAFVSLTFTMAFPFELVDLPLIDSFITYHQGP